MVVRVRFEFSDTDLRAIARHYGEAGRASHAAVKTWIETAIGANLEDIVSDYEGGLDDAQLR